MVYVNSKKMWIIEEILVLLLFGFDVNGFF